MKAKLPFPPVDIKLLRYKPSTVCGHIFSSWGQVI